MNRILDADGQDFALSWPVSETEEMILASRSLLKRYVRSNRLWLAPATNGNAARVLAFAKEHQFIITPEAFALYNAHKNESPTPYADRIIKIGKGTKGEDCAIIASGHVVPAVHAAISTLPGSMVVDRVRVVWGVPFTHAATVLEVGTKYQFNFEGKARAILQAQVEQQQQAKRRAQMAKDVLVGAAKDIAGQSFGGKIPREYQVLGVSRLVEMGSGFLADDMGLGKTLEAALWARAYKRAFGAKPVVICPTSLTGGWLDESEACGLDAAVCTWAKIPDPLNVPYVAIFDEAHNGQDRESIRSKAMVRLSRGPNCKGVLMVSGTPIRGARAENAFPLLRALKHPLGKDWAAYNRQYCQDDSGAKRVMKQINHMFLRRTKEQVAKDLPPKQRIIRRVEPEAKYKALYDELVRRTRHEAAERKRQKIEAQPGEYLTILGQLRQLASMGKMPGAIDLADEVLHQGQKIILFTAFLESARKLAAHYQARGLQTELLTGQSKDRPAMIERFQRGKSRVWVSTIDAGGVGLTLTAASNVILLDQDWIIDDNRQAGDRAHRIGQTEHVFIYWLKAFDIDGKIQKRLIEQEKAVNSLYGDEPEALRARRAKHIAEEVAYEMFETNREAA